MSQTDNPETRAESSASKEKNKPLCHIHDKVESLEVDYIRKNVCVNDEKLKEFEGKHYCLFHFPSKDKDIPKFKEKFKARIKVVEDKIAEIEKLPEDKQANAARGISYDFRYFWFPSLVGFNKYKFLTDANFSLTTFMANADFRQATFMAHADFKSVTFKTRTYFRKTTFMAVADFRFAKFSDRADFKEATFTATANFYQTRFGKKGVTRFDKTNFEKDLFFDETEFNNDISFKSARFGKESDVFFRDAFFAGNVNFQYCTSEGYLRFSSLRQGKNCRFDFHEAAFEKASRVSFYTVRLFPNWFVNVDARKFVFTNIDWQNLDSDWKNENITRELKNLEIRGIVKQNKRLLEIAARQLAVNAEENNRYEKASKFRRMAFETEWLEIKHKSIEWFNNILDSKTQIENNFGYQRVDLLAPLKRTLYIIRHFEFPHFFYRYLSYYGESWKRAIIILAIAIFILFPLIYTQMEFQVTPKTIPLQVVIENCQKPNSICEIENRGLHFFSESIPQSLATATLQTVEYRIPKTAWGSVWLILEKIFAPVQAALLALAIRRKFMR